jgi:hypothetical protein
MAIWVWRNLYRSQVGVARIELVAARLDSNKAGPSLRMKDGYGQNDGLHFYFVCWVEMKRPFLRELPMVYLLEISLADCWK